MIELHPIFEARNRKRASVVFIHGLGGDPFTTWGAGKDGMNDKRYWPRWLAEDIDGLSVYSAGYHAPVSDWEGQSSHIITHAWEILDSLLGKPELKAGPVYFVGHSLGGLVIKQLMRTVDSEALIRDDAKTFLRHVEKVVFLATPHLGSDLATRADLLRIVVQPSPAADILDRGNPVLLDLYRWYRNWANCRQIAHLALAETEASGPLGLLGKVVALESADPGLANDEFVPVDGDHKEIAKPENRNSEVYIRVRRFLMGQAKRPQRQVQTEVQTGKRHKMREAA
ncbi:MAG: alpha/beta fold hydrolase [Beijerinckiaceae bacterium]|nr:alpha/beta fold hydrolase [Beijerinckiaceae bacterium]